jgi:hypothetical protein
MLCNKQADHISKYLFNLSAELDTTLGEFIISELHRYKPKPYDRYSFIYIDYT